MGTFLLVCLCHVSPECLNKFMKIQDLNFQKYWRARVDRISIRFWINSVWLVLKLESSKAFHVYISISIQICLCQGAGSTSPGTELQLSSTLIGRDREGPPLPPLPLCLMHLCICINCKASTLLSISYASKKDSGAWGRVRWERKGEWDGEAGTETLRETAQTQRNRDTERNTKVERRGRRGHLEEVWGWGEEGRSRLRYWQGDNSSHRWRFNCFSVARQYSFTEGIIINHARNCS